MLKNARHEKFVIALLKGKSQSDAAVEAGYSSGRARITGAELVTNRNIIARRQELESKTESDAVLTATQRKERLSFIASEDNDGKYGYQRQGNISAIAELNKMTGDNAPEKHALLGDILIEVVYKDA